MKPSPMAGSLLRIGVALILCAACFQAGRIYQELTASAEAGSRPDAGDELAASTFMGPGKPAPAPVETSPRTAPGDVEGAGGDIITPLNVRDPTDLVMGPGRIHEPPPAASEAPQPRRKEGKPRRLKEGRLLELMKKADPYKSDVPKHY